MVDVGPSNHTSNDTVITLESKFVYVFNYCYHYSIMTVPAPSVSITVTGNTTNPSWPIGDNVTLNCIVELSSTVDIPVTVTTTLRGPAGFLRTKTAEPNATNTSFSSTVIRFNNTHSGVYTCMAKIMADSVFLNDSRVAENRTRITTGKKSKYIFITI